MRVLLDLDDEVCSRVSKLAAQKTAQLGTSIQEAEAQRLRDREILREKRRNVYVFSKEEKRQINSAGQDGGRPAAQACLDKIVAEHQAAIVPLPRGPVFRPVSKSAIYREAIALGLALLEQGRQ